MDLESGAVSLPRSGWLRGKRWVSRVLLWGRDVWTEPSVHSTVGTGQPFQALMWEGHQGSARLWAMGEHGELVATIESETIAWRAECRRRAEAPLHYTGIRGLWGQRKLRGRTSPCHRFALWPTAHHGTFAAAQLSDNLCAEVAADNSLSLFHCGNSDSVIMWLSHNC